MCGCIMFALLIFVSVCILVSPALSLKDSRTLHPVCSFTVRSLVWACMHDGTVHVCFCVVQRNICNLNSVEVEC